MLIAMSEKEISRFKVIQDVCEHRLRSTDAAEILSLSERQVQRLMNKLREHGAASLTHASRGKPSNRRYSDEYRKEILSTIHKHYSDFSPTFAREKIIENHHLAISLETLRQWMIADNLWIPHSQRKPRIYQPRYRRDCLGELIQIDGSHHDWFEGRSDKCCLLVFIDDATGRLMNLRFSETESAFDYMLTTREYLNEHGKPIAFYSDKHSIFRVNQEKHKQVGQTQYGRVLKELAIELICANSSQAKGRVERANLTLQDRLVKEMRLQGINTIEQANAWLPYFIADFNHRFAKPAQYPKDMTCCREIVDTPRLNSPSIRRRRMVTYLASVHEGTGLGLVGYLDGSDFFFFAMLNPPLCRPSAYQRWQKRFTVCSAKTDVNLAPRASQTRCTLCHLLACRKPDMDSLRLRDNSGARALEADAQTRESR